MVDVSERKISSPTAVAERIVQLPTEVLEKLVEGDIQKRCSVFQAVIIAGVMGAKQQLN